MQTNWHLQGGYKDASKPSPDHQVDDGVDEEHWPSDEEAPIGELVDVRTMSWSKAQVN